MNFFLILIIVTTIMSSCAQSINEYQEKDGGKVFHATSVVISVNKSDTKLCRHLSDHQLRPPKFIEEFYPASWLNTFDLREKIKKKGGNLLLVKNKKQASSYICPKENALIKKNDLSNCQYLKKVNAWFQKGRYNQKAEFVLIKDLKRKAANIGADTISDVYIHYNRAHYDDSSSATAKAYRCGRDG